MIRRPFLWVLFTLVALAGVGLLVQLFSREIATRALILF